MNHSYLGEERFSGRNVSPISGRRNVKPREQKQKETIFPVKSPNDQYRSSNTFLTIDFLFPTNDLGRVFGEISKFEENTPSFLVVKHQDGGRDHGKRS